jgi:NAD(P)-dependent dehydrogenase (short-subunit alcohol dehydrogenase family)
MGHVGGVDCATKYVVEGMIKPIGIEWSPKHISVSISCPPFIRPPLATPERRPRIETMIKLGRVCEVTDILAPLSIWPPMPLR